MKKFLLFTLALLAFVACTQNDVEELATNRADVPETLTVGFEGGDTRIQLNAAQKTVWNAGDEVSVFFQSYTNMKWTFQGEDGDRSGVLKAEDKNYGEQVMDDIIIVYPYSSDYRINLNDKTVLAELSAVQHYLNGSYGKGGNIMVTAGDLDSYKLCSVCGWLRIDLTGDGQKVRKISLQGNREEQLAGLVNIDMQSAEIASFANDSSLVVEDAVYTEITLNCSEGVKLGAEVKSFYIGVLPQTFDGGVTITIECTDGSTKTIGTTNAFTLQRNHIKPINCGQYDGKLPEVNELAYRTNDGKKLDPMKTEGFGGKFMENQFDASTSEGKLIFDGAITAIPDQAFGLCENLTWIDLPLGITTIGESSFNGCSSMEEITIPVSVTSIGNEAFKGCTGKAYVNCSGVSFSHALFSEVIIGDSVTSIGDASFRYCDSLTTVIIGDSVTTIGWAAFDNCKKLSTVIFGDSLTKIGGYAFASCESIASVTFPDNLTIIDDYAFHFCSGLVNITIPDSVTAIGMGAFSNCHSLISVTISACVTTIGYTAFAWNSSLTSVYCRAVTPTAGDSYTCLFDNNAPGRIIYVPMDSVRQYKTAAGWSNYADAIVGYNF